MSNGLRNRILVYALPITEPHQFMDERRFPSKGGEFVQIVNERDPNKRYAHIAYWASPEGG